MLRLIRPRRDAGAPFPADLHESDLEHAFDVLVRGRYLLDYGNMVSFYQFSDSAANGDRDLPMPTPTPPAAKRRKIAVAAEPTEPEYTANVVWLALLQPGACDDPVAHLSAAAGCAHEFSPACRPRTRTGASILSASSCCCARRCAVGTRTAAAALLAPAHSKCAFLYCGSAHDRRVSSCCASGSTMMLPASSAPCLPWSRTTWRIGAT